MTQQRKRPQENGAQKRKHRVHKKALRRQRRMQTIAAVLTTLACVALFFVVINVVNRHAPDRSQTASALSLSASGETGAQADAARTAPVLSATLSPTDVPATPSPSPEPTSEPTAEPTVEPTIAPVSAGSAALVTAPSAENAKRLASLVKPELEPGFLPVVHSKKTDEKIVAITIDDCNQPENLKRMLQLIAKANGSATIFPIGQNVETLAPLLKAAHEQGFEIENHTWSHSGLYDTDDDAFTAEIWKQNAAVSKILGVNYQMHFLRPRGGDDRYDQRTHAYLNELGYYGIAYWSQVGSTTSVDQVMNSLAPGDVLLYHTTDDDMAKISALVPRLVKAGYRLVTLNEMFGLPENETGALTDQSTPAALNAYTRFDQTLKKGDYLRDVDLVQARLSQLGFLNAAYNGYYGDTTARAVTAFQQSAGLNATGEVDPQTWKKLFPEQAA